MKQVLFSDGRPIRYLIRDALLDFIRQKGYRPGDQLPSEERLQEIFNVSRLSMREALQLLEEERIIVTKHGSGRYVLSLPSNLDIDISNLQSVTELLNSYKISTENKLLRVEAHYPNAEECSLLQLEPDERVLSIERIRYADVTPIIYSIDTIPIKFLPSEWSEEDFKGSLFEYIEKKLGKPLHYSQATIHACRLEDANLPFETKDLIWILLKQLIYTELPEPFIYSRDYHRADRIQFHIRRIRR
ncbi:MAG: GntR family transcriptional regulator [Anaerolineales bacterium]|nr:GntR family transcriptional regulator [Anaerolineales bacterium]MCS7247432.1 GntR family transcriptional regulator [Anaerolineales bacterium]MDW8161243.1 GntR family transcriptional regulator [Anaerolineales bacterium]MDW8445991.1 GntR family transcriptional regulator [Anaerolineales bacterium]